MTAKLVWIEAITQRPAIRWRTSRSARRSDSPSKRSASSSPRPIVFPSRMPLTEATPGRGLLEMSASDSCVDFAIRRRSFPTRRVSTANNGISANAKSASCQLRSSMPIIVATTVVTLDVMLVAVYGDDVLHAADVVVDPRLHLARACSREEGEREPLQVAEDGGSQVVHDTLPDLVREQRLNHAEDAGDDRDHDHSGGVQGDRARVVRLYSH